MGRKYNERLVSVEKILGIYWENVEYIVVTHEAQWIQSNIIRVEN